MGRLRKNTHPSRPADNQDEFLPIAEHQNNPNGRTGTKATSNPVRATTSQDRVQDRVAAEPAADTNYVRGANLPSSNNLRQQRLPAEPRARRTFKRPTDEYERLNFFGKRLNFFGTRSSQRQGRVCGNNQATMMRNTHSIEKIYSGGENQKLQRVLIKKNQSTKFKGWEGTP